MSELKNHIIDTEREIREDHSVWVARFLVTGASGIEAQELAGQRQLLASTTTPRADRDKLTALGFQFPDQETGDPLFIFAILPEGWKKQETEHPLHSVILDAKGRKRITVFYKAAYYDRCAHMGFILRYVSAKDYSDANHEDGKLVDKRAFVLDNQTGARLFYSTSTEFSASYGECKAWMDENKPDWRNPVAYWDE